MGVIDNLGYVAEATYYPCYNPDPILMIKAAGNALGPVLLSAGTFGCLDIVRMRAGISPWHSRGLKALINGAVKPAEHDAFNKVYKYLVPLEKVLFFWFVVDLTTEFVARWHSQAFKLGACGHVDDQCTYGGPLGTWVAGEADHPRPISYFTTTSSGTCHGGGGSRFVVPPGWYWQCHFSLTPEAIFRDHPVTYCDMMLLRVLPTVHEYPMHRTEPPWFGNPLTAIDQRGGKNERSVFEEYEMNASTNAPARGKSGSVVIEMSLFPLYNKPMWPVNCLGAPMQTAG